MARAFEAAVASWSRADCGDNNLPGLCLNAVIACGANEAPGTADVVVRFWDEEWPFERRETALAHTRVAFDSFGAIERAEVNLNTGFHALVLDEEAPGYDLQETLVHELGHALGLDHSLDHDAVMHAQPRFADTAFRDLKADDREGVCSVYSPVPWRSVDATTPNGRSCGPAGTATLCSATPSRLGHGAPSTLWLVFAALLTTRARRFARPETTG